MGVRAPSIAPRVAASPIIVILYQRAMWRDGLLVREPRLAATYDLFERNRSDLDGYAAMVAEFGVTSVLDVVRALWGVAWRRRGSR